MTYVLSDLHGAYALYERALRELPLQEEDKLYILGDVLDRGSGALRILEDMQQRKNVYPLIGNHEYMAYQVLSSPYFQGEADDSLEYRAYEMALDDWLYNGGLTTYRQFSQLSSEELQQVLAYIADFEAYFQLEIAGTQYVLVHGGISHFQPEKDLEDYELEDFLFHRCDYQKEYFSDKILVTGHTPTRYIQAGNVIYTGHNHIAIDCGASIRGQLGVICLETREEWYFS